MALVPAYLSKLFTCLRGVSDLRYFQEPLGVLCSKFHGLYNKQASCLERSRMLDCTIRSVVLVYYTNFTTLYSLLS